LILGYNLSLNLRILLRSTTENFGIWKFMQIIGMYIR